MTEEFELPTPINPLGDIKEQDRITLSMTVSHQHFGDDAINASCVADYFLESIEQPYFRKTKVDPTPTAIPCGHVGEEDCVGLVFIKNMSNARTRVLLDEEQKAAIRKQVVVLTRDGIEICKIRPGLALAIELVDHHQFKMHCEAGEAVVHVTIFPQ